MTSRTTSREGRTSAASEPRERSGALGPPRASVQGGPAGRQPPGKEMTRRELLETMGTMAVVVAASPMIDGFAVSAQALPLAAVAGPDRVVMRHGKTYLNGWVGYGAPPRRGRRGSGTPPAPPAPRSRSGAHDRMEQGLRTRHRDFCRPKAAVTTATFSAPGEYVLKVTADNGVAKASSILTVKAELPPPATPLAPIVTKSYTITSPLWWARAKALIVSWIPHCVDQINRTICNGRAPAASTTSSKRQRLARRAARRAQGLCLLQRVGAPDRRGDVHRADGRSAGRPGDRSPRSRNEGHARRLDSEDPCRAGTRRLPAYRLHAARMRRARIGRQLPCGQSAARGCDRWSPQFRGNHEGYVAGYFIEVGHQSLHDDRPQGSRLYDAAQEAGRLLGGQHRPGTEEGMVRRPSGNGAGARAVRPLRQRGRRIGSKGDRYISLAKFLLDCRKGGTEYDQSHLPVQQQYEAVGHAVRAVYNYSGMADVAVETRDVDYQSAVKSLWDNIVHRKYYVTGGVGSGETSEGFGPDYSLRNNCVLRSVLELRRDLLPVEDEPRLPRRALRRSVRADVVQRAAGRARSRRQGRSITRTRSTRTRHRTPWHNCPCCVGNIPRTMLMLPTWAYAKDADGTLRQPLHRQRRDDRRRVGHERRDGADDRAIRGTARCRSR